MTMPPAVRKLALATHLTCSVGWIGAVAAYLALDIRVATAGDPPTVRAAWIAMGLITSSALVPLAIASLLTGVVISLGTRWGLFRHWWVVISLGLTVSATVVLWVEAGVIGRTAARAVTATDAEVLTLPGTLPHSAGGLLVLLVIQVLNVYKPQGLTRYGWRKQQEERSAAARARSGPERALAR